MIDEMKKEIKNTESNAASGIDREMIYTISAFICLVVGEVIYFREILFEGKTLGCSED